MALRLVLAGLLLQSTPLRCTSILEFFQENNCKTSSGKVNGTTDGACKAAIANNKSVRVVDLDRGCAASIYSDPFCTNDASVAELNTCMAGSLVVRSFSIDCETTDLSAPEVFGKNGEISTSMARFVVAATEAFIKGTGSISATRGNMPISTTAELLATSSTAPFPGPPAVQSNPDRDNLSSMPLGVIASIAGGCVVLIILLSLIFFVRCYLKKKTKLAEVQTVAQTVTDRPELYSTEKVELAPSNCLILPPSSIAPVNPSQQDHSEYYQRTEGRR